VAITLSSPLV